jgi:hypothetical protein
MVERSANAETALHALVAGDELPAMVALDLACVDACVNAQTGETNGHRVTVLLDRDQRL